jgi:hypothetical protein
MAPGLPSHAHSTDPAAPVLRRLRRKANRTPGFARATRGPHAKACHGHYRSLRGHRAHTIQRSYPREYFQAGAPAFRAVVIFPIGKTTSTLPIGRTDFKSDGIGFIWTNLGRNDIADNRL